MMRIRPYQPGDLAGLVALWEACGLTRPWNDPATDIAFCVASPTAALLVGWDEPARDAQAAGAAATGATRTAPDKPIASVMVGHDGHRGWVYYVAVDPTQQGKGLGAQLMAEAEAWLKARGAPKLHLMVRSTNAQAIGFYERLGYQTEPVATMSKWLRTPTGSKRGTEPDGS